MRLRCSLLLLSALLTGCLQTPDVRMLSAQGAANANAPTAPLPAPASLTQPDPLTTPTSMPAPVSAEVAR